MQIDVQMIKELVKDIVNYGLPIGAFAISLYSLWRTRKVSKLEDTIRECDAFIKKAEVERIKAEQAIIPQALIDGRVTRISDRKHKLFIFNKGDETAYNVDYEIGQGSCVIQHKDVVPFEMLEPGQHFEELAIVIDGGTSKFKLTVKWEDEAGNKYEKEYMKSIE